MANSVHQGMPKGKTPEKLRQRRHKSDQRSAARLDAVNQRYEDSRERTSPSIRTRHP